VPFAKLVSWILPISIIPFAPTKVKKYPEISIGPGDRFHTNKPLVKRSESGQQTFEVDYVLRNGCHAFAQIGTVTLIIFTFAKDGKFLGVQAGQSIEKAE
jgi:hypothetical protein